METVQACYVLFWTGPGSNIPQDSSCMATYFPSQKLSKLDKQDMWDTTGGIRTNVIFFYGPLHMDAPVLADFQAFTSALSGH